MELCLAWLADAGYQPTTVLEALGAAPQARQARSTGAHDLLVSKLSAFWSERAARYDAKLANFSSYFLARFRANSVDIRHLLQSVDADLAVRTVVDVGCGLAQWGLPFFDFNKDATVYQQSVKYEWSGGDFRVATATLARDPAFKTAHTAEALKKAGAKELKVGKKDAWIIPNQKERLEGKRSSQGMPSQAFWPCSVFLLLHFSCLRVFVVDQ